MSGTDRPADRNVPCLEYPDPSIFEAQWAPSRVDLRGSKAVRVMPACADGGIQIFPLNPHFGRELVQVNSWSPRTIMSLVARMITITHVASLSRQPVVDKVLICRV